VTLAEKFANLTPKQYVKFNSLKGNAGLKIFLSETKIVLTTDERARLLELIESGKLPLLDEELKNVAGGIEDYIPIAMKKVIDIIQGKE